MKGIRFVELWAEIKANLVAFISIVMFVCLGIGLFYGIEWGATAITRATEEKFESGKMHDIEIDFPYGLTDDDIAQLKKIDGVSDLEPAYMSFATIVKDSTRYTIKFQSLTDRIDQPIDVEGKLPTKPNEIALLSYWAKNNGLSIGDTITLDHDATDEDDKDGMANLKSDTYTITALVNHPACLCEVSGTLGGATIGSGIVDCVAFAPEETFDQDSFYDSYPAVFIRCDGLRDKYTFTKDYKDAVRDITNDVSDLGEKLGTARYNKLHSDAQEKIDEAENQIDDGEKQIEEGKTQIEDGEKQIEAGKQELSEGKTTAEDAKKKAQAELDNAKRQLDDAQRTYDDNKAKYDSVRSLYDEAVAAFGDTDIAALAGDEQIIIDGETIYVRDIPAKLDEVGNELDSAKQQLDDGWAAYYNAEDEFKRRSAEADEQLKQGQETLDEKTTELEDAKVTIKDKESELDDAKEQLGDAKEQLAEMKRYQWIVLPRLENGGAASADTIIVIMGNVRWAMALLFVLVGLFVCYSAVSRLVNDQAVQIGTKKAVGFREREVGRLYLLFSGIAVLLGTLLAAVVGVYLVQGIMNPAAGGSFTFGTYPAYFNAVDLVIGGVIELVLILQATWIAYHGLLKRNAVELLNGNEKSSAKEHFWEKTKLWNSMSLFSQTVVNNCINDKRRVVATLIGVIGCTALIVTAVTLQDNVARSIERQYSDIYSFDTLVFLNTNEKDAVTNVREAMDDLGVSSVPVHLDRLQVSQPDGYRTSTTLIVPTNIEAFKEYYHILSTTDPGQDVDLGEGGIWISAAYAEHMDTDIGDTVTVTEGTGRTHDFTVAGIFEYYVLHNEFVLGSDEYLKEFGEAATPNVLLTRRGDIDINEIRQALLPVDGYSTLEDDYETNYYAFGELASLLNAVVAVYLILSALMAIIVLLNLDVMFVDEKKREIIVLMINGFSTKSAKAYIYRDSIALTIIGIILGVLLGALMGNLTVGALEPSYGYFIKGFNWLAALVGILGSGVFSTTVLFWSLRKIPRFDLTDINRF